MSESSPLLHHELVTAPDASPSRWLYLLHGIFGSGRNWASVARRFVRAHPEWGGVLVDLRAHGASKGFRPPHTLRSCAADLTALASTTGRPVHALLGHSFGGKVGLAWLAEGGQPEHLWVLDSTPEAGLPGGGAPEMLRRLEELPGPFRTRDELIELLRQGGFSLPVAQWVATNLEGDPESGYRWRFDLAAIRELMQDFADTQFWDVLEGAGSGSTEVHLVRAERSGVLEGEARERVEGLSDGRRVFLHTVPGGHWVNIDAPDELHALLLEHLGGR